jgi:hypothetical protein
MISGAASIPLEALGEKCGEAENQVRNAAALHVVMTVGVRELTAITGAAMRSFDEMRILDA